jgi:hypothetical protein
MKQLYKIHAFLLLFGSLFSSAYAQCPDSTDASLDETKEWISNKINTLGGRIIPPTKYLCFFQGDMFSVYEIGINENLELKDTVYFFQIELEDIDLNKLSIRRIGNNGRFGITIEPINGRSKAIVPLLGNIEGIGYELILQSDDIQMEKRIRKAITHAFCLVDAKPNKKPRYKEKF